MSNQIRPVKVGNITLGIDPISIQSMTNTKTVDIESTIKQTRSLFTSGADIVRISVPDLESVKAFRIIKEEIKLPLVADIHFDYKLAIASLEAGADKVRINPGNIGSWDRVVKVFEVAKDLGRSVRVGVNSGSLEKNLKEKYQGVTAQALVESALNYDKKLLDMGYNNFIMSIKSSDVLATIKTNRSFREKSNTPLHLGVTEAGTYLAGTVKSSIGIGSLLLDGIGETFRVSLTADPVKEIDVAKLILRSLGIRQEGIEIISCPTCARTNGDLISIVTKLEEKLKGVKTHLKVAVMGCVVNGPGEAESADLGLALGNGKAVLFKQGKIIKTVTPDNYVQTILQEIEDLARLDN
jgi:(E)-4-hydroxy-3-methylbut-2-enyl-diphosphate synthase